MNARASWFARLSSQPYALSLVLLLLGWIVVAFFQPDYFVPRNFANQLRSYLPLIFLAVAQTIVVIGGGIDLSLGALMTLSSVVMVQVFGANPGPFETIAGIALGLLVAMLAGAINGWIVAYLRLQPIIATFATSSLWAGVALWVLPQPGGIVPQSVQDFVRLTVIPPFALIVIAIMLLVWAWWLGTRNARALYGVGGSPQAAFASGVNVPFVKLSSYAVGGLIAGFAALFLIGDLATGDPLIGAPLTLSSVVAVVLGGTRLSGGAGSIIGSIVGAIVYYILKNVVAFTVFRTGLTPQWQTLIDGAVVVLALAGPGLARVLRPNPRRNS
jgi:ribose transport system permease protein